MHAPDYDCDIQETFKLQNLELLDFRILSLHIL